MLTGTARSVRAAVVAVVVAVVSVAALASQAAASSPLERFQHCPVHLTQGCIFSKSQYKTDHWAKPTPPSALVAGNVTIPLVKSLVLQGGINELFNEAPEPLVAPEDGAPRVVPTPENVPGGLKGEIDESKLSGATLAAFKEAVKNHETKVTATIEPAPVNAAILLNNLNLLNVEGNFLTLPVKVKFSNPFLGEGCYSGSDAAPIDVELTDATTTGPGEPLTGQLGTLSLVGHRASGEVILIKEDSLVANNFEAPAVEGCGREAAWQAEVDAAINSKAGLPSPPGHNSTRLNGTQFVTSAEEVAEHGF